MTITLSPDIETAVIEQAREHGTTPEQLALESLRRTFVTPKLLPDEILRLAANVYAGLSEQDIQEVEKATLDRSRFTDMRDLP